MREAVVFKKLITSHYIKIKVNVAAVFFLPFTLTQNSYYLQSTERIIKNNLVGFKLYSHSKPVLNTNYQPSDL